MSKELPTDPLKAVEAVRNGTDYMKRQAAAYLYANGVRPRHIRKKLNMSARQFDIAIRSPKEIDKNLL